MTEKLFDGGSLFDDVCERMRAGIRGRFPDADESDVQDILLRQIDRLRCVEESRVYRPVEDGDEHAFRSNVGRNNFPVEPWEKMDRIGK